MATREERFGRAVDEARRVERHAESIAQGMGKEPMAHFMSAGMDVVQAANAAMKSMQVPEETRTKIHRAQKEFLLAMRSAIDDFIAEIDKESPTHQELRRIEIKKKPVK